VDEKHLSMFYFTQRLGDECLLGGLAETVGK